MKYSIIFTSLIIFASFAFGQTPQPSPSPEKTKAFGLSLEKYKNKEKKDSQNRQSNNDDIIQVKTDLVINDILVTDQNGNIITGLQKNDFIVAENNITQIIEMFSFGENVYTPRSIVLIIDTGIPQLPYLKKSIQSAKVLIDKLNPNDKMAIVTDHLRLLADFTKDKILLKKALDSMEVKYEELTNGREFTNLLAVLNEMFALEDRHRIIISQGSGNGIFEIKTDDETLQNQAHSWLKNGVIKDWKKVIEFSDIEEAIQKSSPTIYSIIPGIRVFGLSKKEQYSRARKSFEQIFQSFQKLSGYNKTLQRIPPDLLDWEVRRLIFVQSAMFKVAELSGGYTSFLETPEQAENIYDNIFNDFSNRYSIGYYPTNQEQDGKTRTVKIEVRNHPEYTVLYRERYLQK